MITAEELFLENKFLAERTVYRMFNDVKKIARLKKMDIEDIIGYANEGLWKSCLAWEKSKSQFTTFAINHIKWNVMLKLRDEDNYKYYKSRPNSKHNNVNLEYMDNTLKEDGGTLTFHEVVPSSFNVFENVCDNAMISKVLDLLTDKQKEVLLLKMNGYTYEEIGQRLKISKQAAQKLMRNAKYRVNKIKDELRGVI